MEEWQRKHIRKNLPELVGLTKFTQSLLDKLMAAGVIGPFDVGEMKKEGLSEYTRISELYDVLKTRDRGFQVLTNALLADNQTGAYRILQQGLINHSGTLSDELASVTLFTCIHPEIDELLDDEEVNILIISTPDVQLSLKRITDVAPDYLIMHDAKTSRLSKKKLDSANEETALVIPCDKLEATLKRLKGSRAKVVLLKKGSREEIEELILPEEPVTKVVKEELVGQI